MVDRTPGDGPWLWEQLGVRWADAALRSISVSYDDVVVVLEPDEDWRRQDSSGVSEVWIRCVGYLGIQIVGMWDESIVDHAISGKRVVAVKYCVINDALVPHTRDLDAQVSDAADPHFADP